MNLSTLFRVACLMEQFKQMVGAMNAANDHMNTLIRLVADLRGAWANQVGPNAEEWERDFPKLAARVRAVLGEEPGDPIGPMDEPGDDETDETDELPEGEFQVKDPDGLVSMVEAAGLSPAAYLRYSEYARFMIRIHPDASISGFICRQDGGDDDEIVEITDKELGEEGGD